MSLCALPIQAHTHPDPPDLKLWYDCSDCWLPNCATLPAASEPMTCAAAALAFPYTPAAPLAVPLASAALAARYRSRAARCGAPVVTGCRPAGGPPTGNNADDADDLWATSLERICCPSVAVVVAGDAVASAVVWALPRRVAASCEARFMMLRPVRPV